MIHALIVDDNVLSGTSLRQRLELEDGITAVAVPSARAAHAAVDEAGSPFDLFLIDHRLGPGDDGITLMQALRKKRPETDAIIFTGLSDGTAGIRAYQAGAFRYLAKPFEPDELIWIIKALQEYRQTQWERNGLTTLTAVSEEAQRCLTVEAVAETLVRGGLRLGFERARLWLTSENHKELIGLCQAGNEGLGDIRGTSLPLSGMHYGRRALENREPRYFYGHAEGDSAFDRLFVAQGYRPPVGEWVIIPLWAGNRALGILSLDNAGQVREVRPEQRRVLSLFGEQAAAALERARLHERDLRMGNELKVLNEIGRHITARGALDRLDSLLQEVRTQVGKLMDVRNFMIVLLDEETSRLDFRLHVEHDRLQRRHWRAASEGLVGYIIGKNQPVLLPEGDRAFREKRGITQYGETSRCWLGVPLRVAGSVVGAMVVQSYEQPRAFTARDQHLLVAVADQVAGAIQTSRLAENDAENVRQLAVLNRASVELLRLAMRDEYSLWHATLTMATAQYALRMNRAVLFLLEDNCACLCARFGIGHFEPTSARRDWRRDRRSGVTFEKYLDRLTKHKLRATPVEAALQAEPLRLVLDDSAPWQVVNQNQRRVITASEAEALLPPAYRQRFGAAPCALLPLRMGEQVLGVLLVDNAQDQKPMPVVTLDHLEMLLAQAALALQNLQQHQVQEKLLDANYAIMAEVSRQPLARTLDRICEASRAVTGADCVIIYPLLPGVEPYSYDVPNIASAGRFYEAQANMKPRQKGVTAHILRAGLLVVPDIARHRSRYAGLTLADHPFNRREGIKSFMAVTVRDVQSGELLGALYLNYRAPRKFSEQERHYAGLFANLAAVAIRNARSLGETQAGLDHVRSLSQATERELAILRRVLEESLSANADEEKVIRTLLSNTEQLLPRPGVRAGLALRKWQPDGPAQEPREICRHFYLGLDGALEHIDTEPGRGLAGTVLQNGQPVLADDVVEIPWNRVYFSPADDRSTRAELDVPIRLGPTVIGVLNAESSARAAFTQPDMAALERLAAGAALALDNQRRQEDLHAVLQAARAITTPLALQDTLQAIVDCVRRAAPDLSALTLWYRDPDLNKIVMGKSFGVGGLRDMFMLSEPPADSLVLQVMNATEPIWAPDVLSSFLAGRFARDEHIVSTAAFPLRANREKVGAMFFNYRQAHEFTSEEKPLFTILAEIVAASLLDATRLDVMCKQRDRLNAAQGITEAVATRLEEDQVLEEVLRQLCNLFPKAVPCVLLYDEEERSLNFSPSSLAHYRIDNPAYAGVRSVRLDDTSLATVVARRALTSKQVEYENVPRVTACPDYLPLISTTRSELVVSAMSGERLLGVIVLENRETEAFSQDEVLLVCTVARQVGIALDMADQAERLRLKTLIAANTGWASQLAHEINGVVGHVRNRTYWIGEDPNLAGASRQWLDEIEKQVGRLATKVATADPRKFQIFEHFPLDERVMAWVAELLEDRPAGIVPRCEPGCPDLEVTGSPQVVQMLLQPLIANALEAMKGRGELVVSTRPAGGGHYEILVHDTGPGIPDEVRHSLLRAPATNKGEGRGFGLLLARSMAEDAGGHLHVLPASAAGGATFVITLPVDMQERLKESDR